MSNLALINSVCGIDTDTVNPNSPNYKLTSWPPSDDFPVVMDRNGNVISRFSDTVWHLWPWCEKALVINFMDKLERGRAPSICKDNARILRLVAIWLIFGPEHVACASSLTRKIQSIKRLFQLASREGVLVTEFSKYPRLIEALANEIPPNLGLQTAYIMHGLYHDASSLGFVIMDESDISKFTSMLPDSEYKQTAYIPPRIWNYQITRLEAFISDFLEHQNSIVECFNFCLDAYIEYCGSLDAACTSGVRGDRIYSPFSLKNRPSTPGYSGRFAHTAKRFGIYELLNEWIDSEGDEFEGRGRGIITFSKYLTMANTVCLAYILNFSMMRISEAWSLRYDCLEVEKDNLIGDIYILKGVTTKTIEDGDARWITSPAVKRAVEVAQCVARLRSICESANRSIVDGGLNNKIQYLFVRAQEPWSGTSRQVKGVRHTPPSYAELLRQFPKLLEKSILTITHKDMETARAITPVLNSDRINVGNVWPLAWHQLRRTGAVNMQASGMVSDSSIQYQLKHATRAMSLYYGRGYSKLRLNQSAKAEFIKTMYEILALELKELRSDRFISPHGKARKDDILRIVSEADNKNLLEAAKKGLVAWRNTLLGGCTNRSVCEFGGVDNIARCCGGDGRAACSDLLIDRDKKETIQQYRDLVDDRITLAEADSPYRSALFAQKKSAENAIMLIELSEST